MIVITGGAGFIGSNLVAGLEAAGLRDLVICDTFGDTDKWRNISKREIRDIVKPENIFAYMESRKDEIEMVFHMGGISYTTEKDVDLIVQNNFNLSCKMWEWCAAHGVRLVYASSFATYGDGDAGFVDDDSVEGLAKLNPLSPYGWSKHLFDRRIARLVKTGKKPIPPQWVGLKFFNVYGPNEYHKDDQMSVACKLYPHAEAGASVKLYKSNHPSYKDGEQKRDFIYVQDCVDVMVWLYQNKGVNGIYNLGTGQARTFNDMANAMFAALGKTPKFNYIDMPQTLAPRYQNFTQGDMTKLKKAGYTKPFTSLEDGISTYVKKYLSQVDRYR